MCGQSCRGCGVSQNELSLVPLWLRDCPGLAGGGHVHGQGSPAAHTGLGKKRRRGRCWMQACFIAVQERKHWRKTLKAEAGRLSLEASRELFLQASYPRWRPVQRVTSALRDDGRAAHLGKGRGEEERRHGERQERRGGVRPRWPRKQGGSGAGSSRAHSCPTASCCSGARRKGCRREKRRRVCQRCRGPRRPGWPRHRRGPPAPGSPQRRALRRSPPRLAGGRS